MKLYSVKRVYLPTGESSYVGRRQRIRVFETKKQAAAVAYDKNLTRKSGVIYKVALFKGVV